MSQTLMVRFGADTSAAKRAVVELASTVAQSAVSMATAVRGSSDAVQSYSGVLEKLPGTLKGAVAGFIAFEAVKLTMGAVARSIEEAEKALAKLVTIGAQAQGAGVGTTFLQSWLAQAKGLNEEAGTLEGMLKRAREASTVRQGQGDDGPSSSMADRLALQAKAGNIAKVDVAAFTGAADQEARIRVILDLVERLMGEGKQLAALDIAGQMFGSSFEEKLRSGVDMVGRMRDALNGLTSGPDGRIIPPEEIERAKQIAATLEQASRIMADSMRPVNEDLARYSQQQAQSWAEMKVSIAECVGYLTKAYTFVTGIGEAMAKLGSSQFFKDVVKWMDDKGLIDKGTTIPGIDNGFEKAGPNKPAEGAPLTLKITPKGDRSRNLPKVGGGGSRSEESDPVDGFINSIERNTAALKAEIDTYDKSNAVKRVAIDLAKAKEIAEQNGTKVTAEQEQRIRTASAALAEHKDKLADLNQAQRQAAESARYFGDMVSSSLSDAIFNGAKLTDILKDVTSMLGRGALQAMMTGQGPLAGFLGMAPAASAGSDAVGGLAGMLKSGASAASGGGFLSSIGALFRANGGPVQAGQTYRVNELGEEFFTPSRDGYVNPANRGGGAGMGYGGGVQIIDQRSMNAPAPEVRSGPGGNPQIVLRDAETALVGRATAGRGQLAPAFNTPATRRG